MWTVTRIPAPGLTLAPGGTLTGTPTATGTSSFTVSAEDAVAAARVGDPVVFGVLAPTRAEQGEPAYGQTAPLSGGSVESDLARHARDRAAAGPEPPVVVARDLHAPA